MNKNIEKLQEKARNLELRPGVYLMKNKENEIIYVGKAKILKNRVSSYFHHNVNHTEKVLRMVEQVEDFDYIVVGSEFEALVLECSLIKQYLPKYNILLKDDKGYHYIQYTKEAYPRLSAQKQKLQGDYEYLGPFTSSYTVTQAVEEANRIFMLPTCNKSFPADFRKERPCLNYHIKLCSGVCMGKLGQAEYQENFKNALAYLKKGSAELVSGLSEQMERASENMEFEKAAVLRDRIAAIQKIGQGQRVIMANVKEQDILAAVSNGKTACVTVVKFRQAKLVDKQDFVFYESFDLEQVRTEFLASYYTLKEDIPNSILLDEDVPDRELLQRLLCERCGKRIFLTVATTADQKKHVDIARSNAVDKLSKAVGRTSKEVSALEELKKLLCLEKTPDYIEAYDISNLGDSDIVAGMIVFQNGRPYKPAYRKFALKDVVTQDDYGAMREVLTRRLHRYEDEKDSGEGFGRLPDLILLDGGKGHVAAILPVLAEFGLHIPLFGMVKDSKHKTRAIAKDGAEVSIAGFQSAFSLVTKIQDEVHRFAITFQQKKHQQSAFSMRLTQVSGIGEKKAQALLKAFKTQKALREASAQELRTVAKVSLEKAEELRAFLNNEA